MKRVLSLMLCALLLTSCFALLAYAEEETTAEEGNAFDPLHIVFDKELTGKKNIVVGINQLKKGTISKDGEWPGFKIELSDTQDPHIGIDYDSYIRTNKNEPQNIEEHPVIVLKVLTEEILFDDFELYYCAGTVTQATEECKAVSQYAHEAADGALYFVFDLTDLASGALHSLRVDIVGGEVGALMYLTDIVFFKTEDEALNWFGYYDEQPETEATEAPTTEAPTTEAPTTEAPTEAVSRPPRTEKEEGCGSVIGAGVVTVALISLGAVCIKKKD